MKKENRVEEQIVDTVKRLLGDINETSKLAAKCGITIDINSIDTTRMDSRCVVNIFSPKITKVLL